MKILLLSIAFFATSFLHAQYYYNDIIGTQETNRMMKTYLSNTVRSVSATGVDQSGRPNTDFNELQEVKENGTALKISTRNSFSVNIYTNRFDDQGRLSSITDSSIFVKSVTTYQYDANGKISLVKNITRDTANDFNQTEIHQWSYNASGMPDKMWRTINGKDSLEIRFGPDEDGNVGEERTFRKNIETGMLYYYYDDKKRLSDIVRYNTKAQKLLPDIMFEYDDNDRVIQKTTTTSATHSASERISPTSLNLGYFIWRYIYNEKGLKTKEALFNKDKELTGKIEYTYSLGK